MNITYSEYKEKRDKLNPVFKGRVFIENINEFDLWCESVESEPEFRKRYFKERLLEEQARGLMADVKLEDIVDMEGE
jgi:hypothetical protein